MIGERLSRIQTRWCCYQCALLTVATVGRECVKRILNRILKDSAFGVNVYFVTVKRLWRREEPGGGESAKYYWAESSSRSGY